MPTPPVSCDQLAANYWTLADNPNSDPDDVEQARMEWVLNCNDGVAETGGLPTKPPHSPG